MDEQKKETAQREKEKKLDKKEQNRREVENFKRKYFDYYDDIKISVKEDW